MKTFSKLLYSFKFTYILIRILFKYWSDYVNILIILWLNFGAALLRVPRWSRRQSFLCLAILSWPIRSGRRRSIEVRLNSLSMAKYSMLYYSSLCRAYLGMTFIQLAIFLVGILLWVVNLFDLSKLKLILEVLKLLLLGHLDRNWSRGDNWVTARIAGLDTLLI